MVKALDQHNQGVHPHPWAFIIQIIIGVLAGRKERDRNRSCHKHQMSKLFIVPDIVPDIVLFIQYRRHEPSISKIGIRYRRKHLQYRARYSKFACLCHLISGPISKVGIRYRRKNLRCRHFYPSLPPDIKGFDLISVEILNSSRAI